MKPILGAAAVSLLGVVEVSLACAVSVVLGQRLTGSFLLPNSEYTASCGLSMTSSSYCTAGYVGTTLTILLCVLLIGMQCATAEGKTKYGFAGPLLCILGFVWWVSYAAAATSASITGNHWDSTLTSYRTAVVAMSWCITALFIPCFIVSAVTVSAAARANSKVSDARSGVSKRFNQPASPPVSPCKSTRSYGNVFEPFRESDSPKKWVQPHNPHSGRFAVTSDGLRTLVVVAGQPVPLSPSTSLTHSPASSPARSPTSRSPMHRSSTLTSTGSFSHILLPQAAQYRSDHPRAS